MAACKLTVWLNVAFRRFVVIVWMAFLEAILRNVENGVLVCLKVLDMYLPAVFVVEKCQGMTKSDHVITNSTIICEGKCKLKFLFLSLNNRIKDT